MKHIYAIPAALAAAVSAASCMSYTYMTTSIHPDLSADRTVYTQADSSYLTGETDANQFFFKPDSTWETGLLAEPFRKDFHEEICIMNIYASRRLGSLAEEKLTPAEPEFEGCPVLAPEETAKKHFRWFSTVYEYKAVYRRIEGLPVDLGEFMDRETQEFFLRGGTMPGDWNGLELYSALEEMNSDFMEWYVTSTFKVSHDIIQEMCGVRQRGLLEELSGKILEEYIKEEEDVTVESLCRKLDIASGTSTFMDVYSGNKAAADSLYREQSKVTEYFACSLISEIEMPGKLCRSNATAFNGGNPQWKIDCYRLLYDDITVTAVSREANIWAYILTGIVLSAGIFLLISRKQG